MSQPLGVREQITGARHESTCSVDNPVFTSRCSLCCSTISRVETQSSSSCEPVCESPCGHERIDLDDYLDSDLRRKRESPFHGSLPRPSMLFLFWSSLSTQGQEQTRIRYRTGSDFPRSFSQFCRLASQRVSSWQSGRPPFRCACLATRILGLP